MIDFPLEIPERSGDVLLAPRGLDLAGLLALARINRASLDAAPLPIAGVALGQWRAQAREEALALARRYTAALGAGPVPEGDLLLATGHQPVFFHPGIWVKYLLLDRLAREGQTGLALSVDSDEVEVSGADVPTRAFGRLERRREVLRRAAPEEPYEAHAAPSDVEWKEFLARVARHLQTIPEPAVRAPWEAFRQIAPPAVDRFAAFMIALRRRHEGPRRWLDLPISLLAGTEPFRAFFLHVAHDAARFAAVHNRHLQAYRAAQRIRTDAQPFPDLEVEDRVELPFWTVREGRRQRLFLTLSGRTLSTPAGTLGPLPDDPASAAFSSFSVRPRAVTLTAFLRVFLSDLFIHGVSGARYDRVTDAVVAEFLELRPPAYLAASATLALPFQDAANRAAERAVLSRQIQEARHNPDRLLRDPTAEQTTLVDEKWRLIRRLEAPTLGRAERREATRRIREINERLSASLAGSLAEAEETLAALEEGKGSGDAATYRGYPFFLFAPETMEALVDAMLRR
ncbi:MAG TPA: hypothetical protein VGR25_03550 [bacterium]|nr:hypothetical protein [bacterium]